MRWLDGDDDALPDGPCAGLTFDDGSDFDARDLPHPTCGLQRGFAGILEDHAAATGQPLKATSFVIASPVARRQLDERSLVGRGWWNDDWWVDAAVRAVLDIGCHSWDHVHPDVDAVAQANNLKGDFTRVTSLEDCHRQVRDAGAFIADRTGEQPRHFAYPYGQFSDALVGSYMPDPDVGHGFIAAWTTEPRPVGRGDDRWSLPRYVCGRDWRSPEAFQALLPS